MGTKQSLPETIFNMKMTSKQLKRMCTKTEKKEAAEKKKSLEAMQKGHLDIARVHAGNAIREHNQALQFLKLASRLEGVCSRLEAASKMSTITDSMRGVVDGLDTALKGMDTDKLTRIMDQFEKQFGEVDVRMGYMDAAMDSSLATTTPMDQVDGLLLQLGDEASFNAAEVFRANGVTVPTTRVSLPGAAAAPAPLGAPRAMVPLGADGPAAPPRGPPLPPTGGVAAPAPAAPSADVGSDLAARLAALKAK